MNKATLKNENLTAVKRTAVIENLKATEVDFYFETKNLLVVLLEDEMDLMDVSHNLSFIIDFEIIENYRLAGEKVQEELDKCDIFLTAPADEFFEDDVKPVNKFEEKNQEYWRTLSENPRLFSEAFCNECFDLFDENNNMYIVSFRYNHELSIQGFLNSKSKKAFEEIGFKFQLSENWIEASFGKIRVTLTW